jgi:hypothetical protein
MTSTGTLRVREIMSLSPVTIAPEAPLGAALAVSGRQPSPASVTA